MFEKWVFQRSSGDWLVPFTRYTSLNRSSQSVVPQLVPVAKVISIQCAYEMLVEFADLFEG